MVEEAEPEPGIGVSAHAHGDAGRTGRPSPRAYAASSTARTSARRRSAMMAERGTYLVPTIAIVRDLTIAGRRLRQRRPQHSWTAHVAARAGDGSATPTRPGGEDRGGNGHRVRTEFSTTTLAHELIELTNVGLSPLEALRAATTTAAELFGIEERVGRVEPGLEADLIVLERNPLQGIEVVQDVLMVVSDGRVIVQRGDWPGRPVS